MIDYPSMGHKVNLCNFFLHKLFYTPSIGIDGELLAGSLPVKQLKIITAWLCIHEDELYAAWNNAVRGLHFDKIEPLK